MSDDPALQPYLNLADTVFLGKIHADELDAATRHLPPLNENLLAQLARQAEDSAVRSPRHAWAICSLLDHLAHPHDLRLRSRAAWYLGRAFNHWGQPEKVAESIRRARQGFEALGESDWVAACDWQLNYLVWTKPNFSEATREIKAALAILEQSELQEFAHQCRLSLSYAQILCNNFTEAHKNLTLCKTAFGAPQDPLNLAHCWLNEASLYRRQGNFKDAFVMLEQALVLFQEFKAPLDVAKTQYQQGLWCFLSGSDSARAAAYFEQAQAVFSAQQMDLWVAVCQNGLAQIHIQRGNLPQALHQLQRARLTFGAHGALAMSADNHTDSGQLELLRGNLDKSWAHFQQAGEYYASLGFEYASANALANRGHVSALLGNFQDALNDLEQAQTRYQKMEIPAGMAGCQYYLACIWTNLNQYSVAHDHLNQAERIFEQIQQKAMLGPVYNQRALILSLENRFDEAAAALDSALKISLDSGLAPHITLAERLLGEMLIRAGDLPRAFSLLTSAEAKFRQIGMVVAQAASLTALGDYHLQTSHPEQAADCFIQSLALCQGIMPEVESRCHAGLACAAEQRNQPAQLLAHYRQAVQAIGRLRHSFWQPALAGSYVRAVKDTLDKAVFLAASQRAAQDSLTFIENSKSQTLARVLSAESFTPTAALTVEVEALGHEIREMQAQIRAIQTPTPWSPAARDSKTLQNRLIEAVHAYDKRLAELERKSTRPASFTASEFSLTHFRQQAQARFGKSWLALNYYLTEDSIILSLVTADNLEVVTTSIPYRARMALNACLRSHRGGVKISSTDLKALGSILLPPQVQALLASADTPLIICPHRDLHSVPWAALHPEWDSRHLVEFCVPSLAPSLHLLNLLWKRATQSQPPQRNTGLLLGISDFHGKRPSLPAAVREVESIARIAHPDSLCLLNAEATWEALREQAAQGLSSFAFLHLSSHISHDAHAGRLSSLALSDRDIALEQIRALAPLPGLVTLSACNGAQSLVYEGDEHIDLPTTSLMARANTVISNLWPVLDSAPAADMTRFYRGFFAGLSPAESLAQAQRVSIQNLEDGHHWAGFVCLGA